MTARAQNEFCQKIIQIIGTQPRIKKAQEGLYWWRWQVKDSEFCVYLHGNEVNEIGLVLFNEKNYTQNLKEIPPLRSSFKRQKSLQWIMHLDPHQEAKDACSA